ncbi:hypothetical protein AXF42_Ash009798 [Apostasia shenzhenica]|uniref:Uncharacterized protein n=1 Tax=Apostasia shenzhenica TaxID=1088818 RepID=A0A2I0AX42_9ASPA|nr:hypothetical protein AXF42_Ash009798 [Apostasia shenzhenica]
MGFQRSGEWAWRFERARGALGLVRRHVAQVKSRRARRLGTVAGLWDAGVEARANKCQCGASSFLAMELLAMVDETEVGHLKKATRVKKVPIIGEEEDEDGEKLHEFQSYSSGSKDEDDDDDDERKKAEERAGAEDTRVEIYRVMVEETAAASEEDMEMLPDHRNEQSEPPVPARNRPSKREYQQRHDEEKEKGFFGKMMDLLTGYYKN